MTYLFGMYLEATITVKFPGGRDGWLKAGCDVTLVPVPSSKDVAYILLPKETTGGLDLDEFKKSIEETCSRFGAEVRWVDQASFDGCDPSEMKIRMEESILSRLSTIGLDPNKVVIGVRPVGLIVVMEDDGVKALCDLLDEVDGLHLVIVMTPKGLVEHICSGTGHGATGLVEAQKSDRGPITLGEVADIASMLEHAATVDEFLKSI